MPKKSKVAVSALLVSAVSLGISVANAQPGNTQAGENSNAKGNASQTAVDKLRENGFPGATGEIFQDGKGQPPI